MASLFNLFEDQCKSMWNSSVKLDLFSSAIFKVLFSSYFGLLFSGLLCFMCVLFIIYIGLSWLVLLSFLNCLRKSQLEVTITYPADEEHWDRDLPVEHGQLKLYFIHFSS